MTGTTTPGLSGPGNNGNEGILHTHQISKYYLKGEKQTIYHRNYFYVDDLTLLVNTPAQDEAWLH